VLRGTAYAVHAGTAREIERRAVDGVFSISSILTPFALGTAVGAIASGRVPVGNARGDLVTSWLNPTSLAVGILAVATGTYLAAVYLAGDGARAGRGDLAAAFRRRALGAGVSTGAIALIALVIVRLDGGRVGERLLEWPALAAVAVSAIAGLVTLELVRRTHFESARYYSSAAVASIVVGWALAQRPELLPNLTVDEAAAGRPTMIATVVGVAIGAAILVPSLALLFGLVLRGRFDAADAQEEHDAQAAAEVERAFADVGSRAWSRRTRSRADPRLRRWTRSRGRGHCAAWLCRARRGRARRRNSKGRCRGDD